MDLHIPYEKHKKRDCDFIVQYRFFSPEEGGRKTGNPIQGYRSDFLYDGDEYTKIFMIWPEFLDNENNVILDKSLRIPGSGKANMWIIKDGNRLFHKQKN